MSGPSALDGSLPLDVDPVAYMVSQCSTITPTVVSDLWTVWLKMVVFSATGRLRLIEQ
eukprot:COSAG02_NODE_7844_length_2821_cov_5.184056_1_plen_58_part_00